MMLIFKREVQAALKFTRQEHHYTDAKGKERTIRYQVVGPAEDGSWMFKQMRGDGTWTYVDTAGVCANYYYQGYTRQVHAVELLMLKQHVEKLGQLSLF
jgi:hypothetical protein